MNIINRRQFDNTNAVVALGVWLITLIVYSLTKAPTLSFWDCGEFIAASYILGIPHPPGSPVYVLFGRLFSLLPLWSDIAVRVNMLSAFCSSVTALFGYLAVVRLLRTWFSSDTNLFTRILVYAGGVSGALFAAFGITNWNNSVEAEVYGMTMMLMTASFWLCLVYHEHKGSQFADKIMLLIVYLVFLGVGVHMAVFLILPIAMLFFVIKKSAGPGVWYAVALFFFLELYLIFAFSSRPGEIPYFLPVIIVAIVYFFYIFSFERIPKYYLFVGAGFLLACLPLFGTVLSTASSADNRGDVADSLATLYLLGKAALAVLNILAIIVVIKYFRDRNKQKAPSDLLPPALFIFAASVLILLLQLFKGYIPFLIVSAALSLILLLLLRRHLTWSILIALAGLSLVAQGVKPFFYCTIAAAIIISVLGFSRFLPQWKQALMILLCALAGYSAHLYIPIRSAQQPSLNENNPSESTATTISFLERKQYGSESMIKRMFVRRAEWLNQFGIYRRMGFWSFFQAQYGFKGPSTVFALLLGLFGLWEMIRRKPRLGLPFTVLLLLCTVGLVLYMNFADGTRQDPMTGQDYLEVRERDYFFTPGFVLFGLAIGIGSAALISMLRDSVSKFSAGPRKIILGASLVLFLLPTYTLARNFYYCDRSRNFIPYDYGWNLLDSTPQNGILFTHGDNDTFPLWCLQEVYGLRPDINVVNLSLANTKWYIKQLVNHMKLDLGWDEAAIDRLKGFRTQDNRTFRLQDQVIDAIIDNYFGKRPICFSVTVGQGARTYKGKSIDQMLRMVGMVWEVSETQGAFEVDVERSVDFFLNPDRFAARGVNNPEIYQNEATLRLTRNYGNAFLMVADTLRKAGDLDGAAALALTAVEKIPHAGDPVEFLANILTEQGRTEELQDLIARTYSGDRKRLQLLLGRSLRTDDKVDVAEAVLTELLKQNPTYRDAFDELMRLHLADGQMLSIKHLLQQWLQFNPDDQKSRAALRDLIMALEAADSSDSGYER